ncbi:MAG TPA: protein-glutamate O-methyltransferase CheR [Leptospiraceae bacterium]|nr:protein-glutamate O-methyltransferase CheR [Leptospiraceae bacterium]HMY68137.1 protein-glutamate O-methyltransferase CheR [Leptospiraceae bacterium]HMZ57484.1 protein-glutamate O-methyltransferase CheR [Leptospiraceae bacterium]HNF14770.1 protein-glutamate O-methyltransferase CheR [Leptospiraceae bacterium]HNF27501.1 protein-glutamate O-methyltransferase CheR [Leptospiraceae bacterium]
MKNMYHFIRQFLYKNVGIVLEPEKDYIIEHRLSCAAKESGFSSLKDFLRSAAEETDKYSDILIDELTTTETFFFRDKNYFDLLQKHIIPETIKKNMDEKKIQIWSAVCASGQEAYSIKIILDEYFSRLQDWKFQIYCSDINSRMLEKAKKGEYSEMEVGRGLPIEYKGRYFHEYHDKYVIDRNLVKDMHFSRINLMDDSYNMPLMDIILLRNVLIYFDEKTKNETVRKTAGRLKRGGYLLLGSTEYLKDYENDFRQIRISNTTAYQKI